MCTILIKFVLMGCHGNGKISYSPNEFFLETIFSLIKWIPVNNLAAMRNGPGYIVGSRRPNDLIIAIC